MCRSPKAEKYVIILVRCLWAFLHDLHFVCIWQFSWILYVHVPTYLYHEGWFTTSASSTMDFFIVAYYSAVFMLSKDVTTNYGPTAAGINPFLPPVPLTNSYDRVLWTVTNGWLLLVGFQPCCGSLILSQCWIINTSVVNSNTGFLNLRYCCHSPTFKARVIEFFMLNFVFFVIDTVER